MVERPPLGQGALVCRGGFPWGIFGKVFPWPSQDLTTHCPDCLVPQFPSEPTEGWGPWERRIWKVQGAGSGGGEGGEGRRGRWGEGRRQEEAWVVGGVRWAHD